MDQSAANLIGSQEAADLLGVSDRRIRQLAAAGQLSALRFGHSIVLFRDQVQQFSCQPRKPGYPAGRPRRKPAENS